MTENVKNIIEGIKEADKNIAENNAIQQSEINEVSAMYSGLANGSAYQIYGEAAQDFPAD